LPFFDSQLQTSDRVLRISILPRNSPQNGRFPGPNFVFLEENVARRKFSDRLKFRKEDGQPRPLPATTPLHNMFHIDICFTYVSHVSHNMFHYLVQNGREAVICIDLPMAGRSTSDRLRRSWLQCIVKDRVAVGCQCALTWLGRIRCHVSRHHRVFLVELYESQRLLVVRNFS